MEDFQKNVLKLKQITNDPVLHERMSSTREWTREVLALFSQIDMKNDGFPAADPKHLQRLETELYHLNAFYDFSVTAKRQEALNSHVTDPRVFISYVHQNPILGNKCECFFKKQENPALESLRGKFFDSFAKLFQSKMREAGHFALFQGAASFQGPALPAIDHYVQRNAVFKMMEHVAPSLLFQFAYIGLVDIEHFH